MKLKKIAIALTVIAFALLIYLSCELDTINSQYRRELEISNEKIASMQDSIDVARIQEKALKDEIASLNDSKNEQGYKYTLGYNDGYAVGYEEGKADGIAERSESSYQSGHADGLNDGNQSTSTRIVQTIEPNVSYSVTRSEPTVSQIVYITKTGARYHSANCSYLRSSKIEIDKDEAVSRGYTPCSRCNP